MSNLLIDDQPILVSPKLAELIGLNEAIFLQQIHYWIKKSKHFYDGTYWVYGTHDEWQVQFPFWSVSTIRRTITSLEKLNILVAGNYNKKGFDKTKWYSINYKELESVSSPSAQNEQTDCSDWTVGAVQNEQTNTRDYTETTTDIRDTTSVQPSDKSDSKKILKENFEKLWNIYPNKRGKEAAFKSYSTAMKDGVTNKQIQDGIVNYKQQILQQNIKPQFVAHGSTWFNQKRWTDVYDVEVNSYHNAVENEVTEEKELSQEEIDKLMLDFDDLGGPDDGST